MVFPEDAGSDTTRPRMRRPTIIAVIAVVVALFSLAILTGPDPEATAAPTTTTSTTVQPPEPPVDPDNFSMGQIATGEPLEWTHARSFRNIHPDALAEFDGSFYVFGPASPTFAGRPEGLRAWRSEDGAIWEELGVVIGRDAFIRGVRSTAAGLVAFEVAETELRLWRSVDGVTWDPYGTTLEFEDDYTTALPAAAGSVGESLLIAADTYVDREHIIEQALARVGIEANLSATPWSLVPTSDGAIVEIYGPLGLLASRIDTSELDLTEQEQDGIATAFAGTSSTQTWRVDESVWSPAENIDEIGWIESFVNTPEGDVIAYGGGSVGPASWRSTDGLTWERSTPGSFVNLVTTWGDWLVAARSASRPQIVLSTDGEIWENTDLDAHFPLELQWQAGPLGAGAGGIAAAVEARVSTPMVRDPEPIVVTAEDGRGTLTISFNSRVRFEFDDGVISQDTTLIRGGPLSEGINVDLANQIVMFTDVDTGEVLGTFSFDALNRAEGEYWAAQLTHATAARHQGIAFSPDAESWTIQDMAPVVGDNAWIIDLQVSDDRVVALVARGPRFVFEPGGLFEIWSAEIP